jgi:glycogen debranching enzyme
MNEYTRLIATTFHGCRLDNFHSAALWLTQELMDYGRQNNPNLYISAELFTGNMKTGIHFIHQIGINSLVIESFRSFDPYKLGQMASSVSEGKPTRSFIQSNTRPLLSTKLYSLFYNQVHDNSCPIKRRSLNDVLPC